MSGWYVFALTGGAAAPFAAAGHEVEFVDTHGVYAAIERVSGPPPVSEEALRAQHEVVAAIASRVDAVLPARFGTMVGETELGAVVLQRRDVILDALALVRGRVQMTVRLLRAEAGAKEAENPPERPAATGTEYLESRRVALAPPPLPVPIPAVEAAVRSMVIAERVERGGGRAAATLYHLIDAHQVKSYRKAVAQVQDQIGVAALTVSGPWPPFAFAPDLWT